MGLADFYRPGRRGLSFELFPPKTAAGIETLRENVQRLQAFHPDYFTCTYGAGGSTRGTTLDVVEMVRQQTGLPVASHLTCVGSTVDQLRSYLAEAGQRGADYIVALRGDPPQGETTFRRVENGLGYANELVALIRSEFSHFGIAVAGYPEVHRDAPDADVDLTNLCRKVDAGADVVITQLFYDNDDFYRFRDRCHAAGIAVPIVPGLLPITNLKQAWKLTTMCKSRLPEPLVARLSENESPEWQFEVGVEHARRQTIDLLEHGVDGLHLYVLNKSQATARLLEGLEVSAV